LDGPTSKNNRSFQLCISCVVLFSILNAIQTQIKRGTIGIHVALISCTLFICIETLQGRTKEATQLYSQGVKMLENILSRSQPETGSAFSILLEQIIAIYIRLGTVACITVGVLFELPVPTSDQSSRHFTLNTARYTLIRLVAESLSYESGVAQYQKELGRFGQEK
jgi:hypothetical protein